MYNYKQIFEDKKTVLFFSAHPGDILIFFGALIHQLRKDDKDVYVVTIGNNAIQNQDVSSKRSEEEMGSLRYLGVNPNNFIYLNYPNGEIENNQKLRGDVTKYVRQFKPDIVCTHEPSLIYLKTYSKKGSFIQHHDHRTLGETVIDSVFTYSRNDFFYPEQIKGDLKSHTVYEILLTDEKECNFQIDFTDDFHLKERALLLQKSYFSEDNVYEEINAFNFDGKYLERFNYIKLVW